MKFLLSCVCAFVLFSDVHAQSTVTWGQEQKTTNLSGATSIFLGRQGESFYVLRMEGVAADDAQAALMQDNPALGVGLAMLVGYGVIDDDRRLYDLESYMGTKNATAFTKVKLFLQKYSADCNQEYSKQFTLDRTEDEVLKLKNIILGSDNVLHLFAVSYDKKTYKSVLYHTTFGSDGTLDKNFKAVDEVNVKNPAFTNSKNSFRVVASPDRSKLLLFHTFTDSKNTPTDLNVKVVDLTMKELWSQKYTTALGGSKFVFSKDMITNDGNVYMLAKVQASKEEKSEGAQKFRFVMVNARQGQSELKQQEISVPSNVVTDVYIQPNADGSMNLFGFFSEFSQKKAGGTYVMKLNPDFTVAKMSSKPFTQKNITDILGEDDGDDKAELGNIHVRKAFTNPDGTFTLACENYVIISRYDRDHGFTFHYRYTDIPVFRIKDDATIVWAMAIKKKQKSYNDGAQYVSYVSHMTGDNLQILFNGNKNDMTGKMKNPDNAMVYRATVDKNGAMTSQPLFSTKEIDYTAVPKSNFLYDENSIILLTMDGLKYRYARVDL